MHLRTVKGISATPSIALEHFDITGRWRNKYENGLPIDAEGKLFKKHEFSNALDFKAALMKEEQRFVRSLYGHLMKYALSRKLTPMESVGLDQTAQKTASDRHRLRSIIKEIAMHESFTQFKDQGDNP